MNMLTQLALSVLIIGSGYKVQPPVGVVDYPPVAVQTAMSTTAVMAGEKQTAYLRVSLTGQAPEGRDRRAPINVAIVLDRSGSMQGAKLERAKEAAIGAIDRLHDDDIVSVVAYDSTVDVIVPATKARDRASIHRAIRALQAGNTTALFAGVSKGAHEVRKFIEREYINRIILLSDGLANEGPSTPGALGDLGQSLGHERIAVSTLGLGADYNEDLMTALAQKSDGNHMFIRNEDDLKTAFDRELGDVLSVVAQDVTIRIACGEGVRPVRILGREADISGQTVTTSLNQVYNGQMKYVLLEVELPAGQPGQKIQTASVDVICRGILPDAAFASANLWVRFTDSPEEARQRVNTDVMASVVQQIGAEKNRFALELRDQGKIEESKQVLKTNEAWFMDNAAALQKPELLKDAEMNRLMSSEVDADSDTWRKTRKGMREYQYKLENQQGNYVNKDKE